MVRCDIQGAQYDLCNTWEDVTLERFQRLCAIKVPEKYKQFVEVCLSGNQEDYEKANAELSREDLIKVFPGYFGEVISVLSDIPREVINRMHRAIREQLYEAYLYPFTASVITGSPWYSDNGTLRQMPRFTEKFFEFEGEKYYFPESLIYSGMEIPMYKESILTFSEASDIETVIHEWGEKGIDSVAQVVAVYCRKEGEQYDTDEVYRRIEKFKMLPMPVIWEVFFYTGELGLKCVCAMLLYSVQLVKAIQEDRLKKAG